MAADIPNDLRKALEAFESGLLLDIVKDQNPENYEGLKAIIADKDKYDKSYVQKALFALGRWQDPEIVQEIEQLLPELNEVQRVTAIHALGDIGSDQSLEILTRYFDDSSAQVRSALIDALSSYKNSGAQQLIKKLSANDSEEWLRTKAKARIKK